MDANDDSRDLREAIGTLFSTEVEDAAVQQHTMAYITAKITQDLMEGLAILNGALDSLNSLDPLRFEVGINIVISTAAILPLVLNFDGTLSMVRRPLVPLLRRHIIPFSVVIRIVAREGQAGLVRRFRPWSQYPDVLRDYVGAINPDVVWGMGDGELDTLFSG